jgi:cytochrome oxidase Cu insertion factor (SCO1/SenC/PrrC family)
MTIPAESNTPRSRSRFWLLVAVFFAPLLAAFSLYYAGGWRPAGSTNHGDLIHPPRPLPAASLQNLQGAAVPPDALHGKWTLVYIGAGQCDARCREALTLMRQTRLALGDDASRVQRLFLVTQPCCDQTYLDADHPGLITARADDAAGKTIVGIFPRYDNQPVEAAGRIYIVDPLGNLMMSYAADAKPKGLLEDLKKLLKLSHIG